MSQDYKKIKQIANVSKMDYKKIKKSLISNEFKEFSKTSRDYKKIKKIAIDSKNNIKNIIEISSNFQMISIEFT